MSKNKEKNLNENEEPVTEETVQEVSTAELEKQLEEANKALTELNDKYLRIMAEYENYRRRTAKEKDGIYASALADAVSELLPIIDNLERAAGFDDGDKVREGLKMIASTVSSVLTKLGVESYGAPGDKFDPNLHNAVLHDEDDSERENEITDVFQKGYKKGNKIIRFAMVKTIN